MRSSLFITVLLLTVGVWPTVATGQPVDVEDNYLNLAFTGDGRTPSAAQILERQAREVNGARSEVGSGATGDVSYGVPIGLPPALLAPELSLSYSSAAGTHSIVGRGWDVQAGMRIVSMSARSRTHLWSDNPNARKITGGGLDGVLVPNDSDGWDYISNQGGLVVASFDNMTWTIEHEGVTTLLRSTTPSSRGTFVVDEIIDRGGNRVLAHWSGPLLESLTYGGTTSTGPGDHLVVVELDYVDREDVSHRAADGHVQTLTQRLDSVTVFTCDGELSDPCADFRPRLSYELHFELQFLTDEELLTEVTWSDWTGTDWTAPEPVPNGTRSLALFSYTPFPQATTPVYGGDTPELALPFISAGRTHTAGGLTPNDSWQEGSLYDLSGDGLLDVLDDFDGYWQLIDPLGDTREFWDPLQLGGFSTVWEVDEESRSLAPPAFEGVEGHDLTRTYVMGPDDYASFQHRRLLDIDGDGFQDLVVSASEPGVEWEQGSEETSTISWCSPPLPSGTSTMAAPRASPSTMWCRHLSSGAGSPTTPTLGTSSTSRRGKPTTPRATWSICATSMATGCPTWSRWCRASAACECGTTAPAVAVPAGPPASLTRSTPTAGGVEAASS